MALSVSSLGFTPSVPLITSVVSKSHLTMWETFASRVASQSQPQVSEPVWHVKFELCRAQYIDLKREQASPWHQQLYELCDHFRADAEERMDHLSINGKSIERKAIESYLIMKTLKSALGRIVFVADHSASDFQKALSEIDSDEVEPEQVLHYINNYFNRKIDLLKHLATQLSNSVKSFPIQDLESIARVQASFVMAHFLLTSGGKINLYIVPDLQKALEHPPLNQNIFPRLDQIDSCWQSTIDHVEIPQNSQGSAGGMIRADLGLKLNELITIRHCQIEMLSAMLYTPQDPQEDPMEELVILKDYRNLIRDGCLLGIEPCYIPDQSLKNPISIDACGIVAEYKQPFWKCPQLIAACRQMGLYNMMDVKDQMVCSRFSFDPLTWDTLIELACRNFSNERDEVLLLGKYGFSLAHHRLVYARKTILSEIPPGGPYLKD